MRFSNNSPWKIRFTKTAGRVDHVGIEFADFDQLFDFGDGDFGGGRHHGIEVARGLAIDEIAPFVALPRFDESEVGFERVFHHVGAAVEFARLFSFGDDGAVRRWE